MYCVWLCQSPYVTLLFPSPIFILLIYFFDIFWSSFAVRNPAKKDKEKKMFFFFAADAHRLVPPQSYGSRVSWELIEFQVLLFLYSLPLSFVTRKKKVNIQHSHIIPSTANGHRFITQQTYAMCLTECVVVAVVAHSVSHQYCIAFDFEWSAALHTKSSLSFALLFL